eukprot:Unigene14446_Nuclearia_a/m.43555 Unigene14446_Nuclearia_a/g.43555  ORF Unigene14446_Nuclearia_a/g.43555 Unigene14446_Nuclearia_a/m.43555 type:complete len:345 (-) Unigene14446_Nuclearia_a:31-1065(-)
MAVVALVRLVRLCGFDGRRLGCNLASVCRIAVVLGRPLQRTRRLLTRDLVTRRRRQERDGQQINLVIVREDLLLGDVRACPRHHHPGHDGRGKDAKDEPDGKRHNRAQPRRQAHAHVIAQLAAQVRVHLAHGGHDLLCHREDVQAHRHAVDPRDRAEAGLERVHPLEHCPAHGHKHAHAHQARQHRRHHPRQRNAAELPPVDARGALGHEREADDARHGRVRRRHGQLEVRRHHEPQGRAQQRRRHPEHQRLRLILVLAALHDAVLNRHRHLPAQQHRARKLGKRRAHARLEHGHRARAHGRRKRIGHIVGADAERQRKRDHERDHQHPRRAGRRQREDHAPGG